ncbi:hypothetical protein VZT92_014593 [Zoarces viviparus]|uniref:Uncharacterized protein n=1 Tax=Zoarces viviparus TaxID=48416 RepID=A0AAW1F144_ZOAVI
MIGNQLFQVRAGDLISSSSTTRSRIYFGAVPQCRKVATYEVVALKIIKSTGGIKEANKEAAVLLMRKDLGSEGRFHLEFEKLDISMYDTLHSSHLQSLKLTEICPIL